VLQRACISEVDPASSSGIVENAAKNGTARSHAVIGGSDPRWVKNTRREVQLWLDVSDWQSISSKAADDAYESLVVHDDHGSIP